MKVYSVVERIDYEGEYLVGIYSNFYKAYEVAKEGEEEFKLIESSEEEDFLEYSTSENMSVIIQEWSV